MEMYDVFISFKNTDKNGRTTRDAAMAEALYRALKQKGISVFFSKYSISEAARADYVDAIDNALEGATVFVAVGTSRENLTSGWVKHEINQFRAMLNEGGGKKRSIVSYRSIEFSPNDLPSGLRCYQSYDDQKSVVRFVEACLQKASGFRNDGDGTQLLYEDETAAIVSAVHTPNVVRGLQIGSVLDNRYEIINTIGKGGMAYVYLAIDRRSGKTYAIKEIRADAAKNFQVVAESLRSEAHLMQRLHHPAIPAVYDLIDGGDSFIIVMEYVNGSSLNRSLLESGPFSEAQVLDFARQLADVLVYLHHQPNPVIYRDLKPSNIILKPDGTLKLIDFGAAREYKPFAIGDTTCLGTVGFAAPEQFGGMGQTDPRTDIYNLGATLYHLVTGRNPAEPPYEICPIRQVDPGLSRALESIIQTCTQKDPGKRFQSAGELLKAIEHAKKPAALAALASLFKGSKPKKQKAEVPFRIPGRNGPSTGPADFSVPVPPAPIRPVTVPVPIHADPAPTGTLQPIANPVLPIHSAPTEPLGEAAPLPPKPIVVQPMPVPPKQSAAPAEKPKPLTQKVKVRTKAPGDPNTEMDDVIAKLMSLDPKSQQLVRDLVEQLSK